MPDPGARDVMLVRWSVQCTLRKPYYFNDLQKQLECMLLNPPIGSADSWKGWLFVSLTLC